MEKKALYFFETKSSLKVVERALKEIRFELKVFSDIEKACEFWSNNKLDLVVAEVDLNELKKKLKKCGIILQKNVPVIIINSGTRVRVLQKPLDQSELIKTIISLTREEE